MRINDSTLEKEYNQTDYENLLRFFIDHFSITNSTTSGNQVRICVYAEVTTKSCGSANTEIFVEKLADLETKLNKSFDANGGHEMSYHLVVGTYCTDAVYVVDFLS